MKEILYKGEMWCIPEAREMYSILNDRGLSTDSSIIIHRAIKNKNLIVLDGYIWARSVSGNLISWMVKHKYAAKTVKEFKILEFMRL